MDELPPTWCEEDLEARGQGLVRTKKGHFAEEAPATHWASFPGLGLDRGKVDQTCTIRKITLGESP